MPDIEAPAKYPPVGRCIYCGTDNPPLTDEHIVPFGLGGQTILPKASCRRCAHITGAVIERYCLQNTLGVVRYQRGFKSRHPKQRPTKFSFVARAGLTEEAREEDYSLHPSVFTVPVFDYPTILCDLPPGNQLNARFATISTPADPNIRKILTRHPDAQEITFRGELNMSLFARMLAKMAYSSAVAEYGFEALQSSPLRKIILERASEFKFHHYIGGALQAPPRASTTYELTLERRVTLISATEFLVASIRIFADLGAPQYYVAILPSAGLGAPRSTLAPSP